MTSIQKAIVASAAGVIGAILAASAGTEAPFLFFCITAACVSLFIDREMVLGTLPSVIRNPLEQVFFALRDSARFVLKGAALLGIFGGIAVVSFGLFAGVSPWIPWAIIGLSFFFFLYARRHGFSGLVYWVLCGVCGALCVHAVFSLIAPLSGGVLSTLFSPERLWPSVGIGLGISVILLLYFYFYDTGMP